MNVKQSKWISIHIYYNSPWENFLTFCLKPFVEIALEEKLIESFFFIRYWEAGPHIRLRLKGRKKSLEKIIKLRAEYHFNQYISLFPSESNFSETKDNWLPNNSIHWIDYIPEIERYGGIESIFHAEKYFQYCSETVLKLIEQNIENWDYETALGAGLQMHIAFIFASRMQLNEIRSFYTELFKTWLPRSYYWTESMTDTQKIEQEKMAISAFENALETQKEAIFSFIKQFWDSLESKFENEHEWLNTWIKNLDTINNQFISLRIKGGLKVPNWYLNYPNTKKSELYVYGSFFHMTNNRLGILNRDEGFLAYILKVYFSNF